MFKVGDKVKLINCYDMAAVLGATGIVGQTKERDYIYVKWDRNGLDNNQFDGHYSPSGFELINPSPIRTATKREIVSGVYGRVKIDMEHIHQPKDAVAIQLVGRGGSILPGDSTNFLEKDELKAAAKVFLEIAEVLEEQCS